MFRHESMALCPNGYFRRVAKTRTRLGRGLCGANALMDRGAKQIEFQQEVLREIYVAYRDLLTQKKVNKKENKTQTLRCLNTTT